MAAPPWRPALEYAARSGAAGAAYFLGYTLLVRGLVARENLSWARDGGLVAAAAVLFGLGGGLYGALVPAAARRWRRAEARTGAIAGASIGLALLAAALAARASWAAVAIEALMVPLGAAIGAYAAAVHTPKWVPGVRQRGAAQRGVTADE